MKVLILFLFLNVTFAFEIEKVDISCSHSDLCLEKDKFFNSLKRQFVDEEHFKSTIRVYSLNTGIVEFSYKVLNDKGINKLVINWIPKRRIRELNYRFIGKSLELPSLLPLTEGGYLDSGKVSKTLSVVKELYIAKGYPRVKVKIKEKILKSEEVDIDIVVELGTPTLLKDISVNSSSVLLKKIISQKLHMYKNKPFSKQEVRKKMDEIKSLFYDYGYYLHQMNLQFIETGDGISLNIQLTDVSIHSYQIRFLDQRDQYSLRLKSLLRDTIISSKRLLSDKSIEDLVKKELELNGYLLSEVSVTRKKIINSLGEEQYQSIINISKGKKARLTGIDFKGNNIILSKKLRSYFYQRASDQSGSDIFDLEYYKSFLNVIREEYIKNGYVNISLESPEVIFNKKNNSVKLVYRLREGIRARVDTISISGIPQVEKYQVEEILALKADSAFNPVDFKLKLGIIKKYLKNNGYYFSRLVSEKQSSIVSYNRDNTKVNIHLNFYLGRKYFFGDIIVIGNAKTKLKVLLRELIFKKGELLSLYSISKSQTKILSTGLFSSVVISPVKNSSDKADILISVKEKDYGLVELAPGIRNDLGPKLSAKISYANIDGLNKQLSFKGQVNSRFNLNSLDKIRREEKSNLLEYLASINYTENYLFDYDLSLESSLSYSRIRFFSFDVDSQKVSNTVSTDINTWFNFSLTHELEILSQYNATDSSLKGSFQIGSLTPAVTLDFRNNRINPTSGSYFSLSTEFANPALLSQSNDELVVDYYKLISRNRFYIPFSNGVFALSFVSGIQKNQATNKKDDGNGGVRAEGRIPPTKIFRLAGLDNVRGFEDDEINRIIGGGDIINEEIDNTAYMFNLKVEPRIFLSDSTMLGVFYDAGRVFVDEYDLSKLRSSVGLSFKYLTPVGSLDFDYGIKLLRNKDDDGRLESPGRLHVSIGFF